MAAILAAAHHGIEKRIEPPPMIGEGVDPGPADCRLPRWEYALDDFDASSLWPEYLGAEFCKVYSTARRFEAAAYHAEVPVQDYEWYLGSI
jgi:glutamine synthetase